MPHNKCLNADVKGLAPFGRKTFHTG